MATALIADIKIKQFISTEIERAYDEGSAEATMVCNEKTIPLALASERIRVRGEISKMMVIMDPDRPDWVKRIARNETLKEVLEIIK